LNSKFSKFISSLPFSGKLPCSCISTGAANQIKSHSLCAVFSVFFHRLLSCLLPPPSSLSAMGPKPAKTTCSRKAATKTARGKAPASVEDESLPYTISVANPRAATWTFFDNTACRQLVTLFDDDTIVKTSSKDVALILRDMIPYVVHIVFSFYLFVFL
jgi:hypothetical protein